MKIWHRVLYFILLLILLFALGGFIHWLYWFLYTKPFNIYCIPFSFIIVLFLAIISIYIGKLKKNEHLLHSSRKIAGIASLCFASLFAGFGIFNYIPALISSLMSKGDDAGAVALGGMIGIGCIVFSLPFIGIGILFLKKRYK